MTGPSTRRTSAPPYRALRFLFTNIDATDEFAGLTISTHGGIGMVEGNDSVRQAIFLLLSTTPGERVMRPSYGCELRRLVFSPNDDTTAGLAIHYTRRALERWEPRIEIHRLDARRDPEAPGWLILVLEYRVRATQHIELATFSFSLTGDEF
jgi:phage baseplate assembly protein W